MNQTTISVERAELQRELEQLRIRAQAEHLVFLADSRRENPWSGAATRLAEAQERLVALESQEERLRAEAFVKVVDEYVQAVRTERELREKRRKVESKIAELGAVALLQNLRVALVNASCGRDYYVVCQDYGLPVAGDPHAPAINYSGGGSTPRLYFTDRGKAIVESLVTKEFAEKFRAYGPLAKDQWTIAHQHDSARINLQRLLKSHPEFGDIKVELLEPVPA